MPEGFHPFPSRTRKLRPPGPMILGAQAPGKVGHRQVNKQKTISNQIVFLCFCNTVRKQGLGSTRSGSTLLEFTLQVAMWRKSHPTFVTLLEFSLRVAVWRKARPPFVYRTRKLRIHTAGVCVISRSVAKSSSAFRSRAKDTWSIAPGKVGHRQVNKRKTISYEVVFLC